MFTGIVEEIGKITRMRPLPQGKQFWIVCPEIASSSKLGDSICVNGVCLTVSELEAEAFRVEAVGATLEKTSVGTWKERQLVHLERAMTLGSRLGGHIVQGHVNGLATVTAVKPSPSGLRLALLAPEGCSGLVREGSVAIDGVSLTISKLDGRSFEVSLVPHTIRSTLLGHLRAGNRVHLETDVLLRGAPTLTSQKLAEWGYGS